MSIRNAMTAITAAAFFFVIASVSQAQPNTGGNGAKKGCTIKFEGPGAGQSIEYEDGYSMSVVDRSTGKTHTYTCNDGKWTETVSIVAQPVRGYALASIASATLTLRP
jgi:hypothetical protein